VALGVKLKGKLKRSLLGRLGKAKSANDTLKEMRSWIVEYSSHLSPTVWIESRNDKPTLFCRLHPAAENLEISFLDSEYFTVSANTTSAGPGYHIFVGEMLHALTHHFDIVWDKPTEEYCDEISYFYSRDQEQVFDSMSAWLRSLVGISFDGNPKAEHTRMHLAMQGDVTFSSDAVAITPLGPRDIEWVTKIAEDGRNGRDFFAWWAPVLDAEYFLNRALVRMWSDVRWRAPTTDEELQTMRYVSNSLWNAYQLDPGKNYPWAEWNEVLDLLQENHQGYRFVREKSRGLQPGIGYRRRDVEVALVDNWSITVPGSFSDFAWDEKGNYFAVDPPRNVSITVYAFDEDSQTWFESKRQQLLQENRELVHELRGYFAAGEIKKVLDKGVEFFQLLAHCIAPGWVTICAIAFNKPEERDWAITVWKSLTPPNHQPQLTKRIEF
jgi:hypothetical protein